MDYRWIVIGVLCLVALYKVLSSGVAFWLAVSAWFGGLIDGGF